MTAQRAAQGRKVLVVEDEMMVVLLIEQTLHDLGAEIVGPAANLNAALELADRASIDAAVLDINIGHANSYAVADILAERGIPFVFCSGYSNWALEERHRARPRLAKPYTSKELEGRLLQLLSTSAA